MNTVIEQRYEQIQRTHELDVYGKRGPTLVSGLGARVQDVHGRQFIDCIAGHGAANLGHCHPRVVAAIAAQAARLISCPGSFYNDAKALFLELLLQSAPANLDRAFLCNSGTESVEAAIKFARIHTGRTRILAMKGGFHGRTYGAMSATFNPKYSRGSAPLVPGFEFISFNDAADLRRFMGDDVAAILLEPVQGEGGVHLAQAAFLWEARNLCDRHGALLIVDEVQTGMGRTGSLFACDIFGLKPDLLCLAKSLAGGFPMGAVLVDKRIEVAVGLHGSTFGGNPVACAAGRAALEVIRDEDLADQARDKGRYLVEQLRGQRLAQVREIRHLGLMIGIEIRSKARPVIDALAEHGVLALPAGATVVRLLPPLVIGYEELDQVAQALVATLS